MGNQVLLACGVAAGPLFTTTYLLMGVKQRGYKSSRHPVSSLALGPAGWVQTMSFISAGLLSLALSAGLWRVGPSRWGALLVGLWAVGLVGAGIFRTDPVRGYPPGTPDRPARPTRTGALHDLLSLVAFLGLAVACFVLALPGPLWWAVYSIASGVLFAATMLLAGAAFERAQRVAHLGGLVQRTAITIGWTWLTLLAVRTLHS
ncbi:DUF998 domain-containing protein [Streptomyces sp. ISL-22]|uniref:DUF998 domain-containing protein n=1 Tax=unclassified Streptomyces TaxID=2593676 RepID=UPI001BE4E586|nr:MULTISPECIES: DUF998 domain-containing protein [unclassified Streptomyces]MBT2424107.1 DUF998 domain-containing protein [Streptomyces sp. ISL-24]MBT2438044.1 DUF998 domain-containing protein [Streptomyces sp. ISL-22]